MARKELFKSLIALSQAELPFERIEREMDLPVQPELIITVPGVRRAGKSSLLMLAVNKLLTSGITTSLSGDVSGDRFEGCVYVLR